MKTIKKTFTVEQVNKRGLLSGLQKLSEIDLPGHQAQWLARFIGKVRAETEQLSKLNRQWFVKNGVRRPDPNPDDTYDIPAHDVPLMQKYQAWIAEVQSVEFESNVPDPIVLPDGIRLTGAEFEALESVGIIIPISEDEPKVVAMPKEAK